MTDEDSDDPESSDDAADSGENGGSSGQNDSSSGQSDSNSSQGDDDFALDFGSEAVDTDAEPNLEGLSERESASLGRARLMATFLDDAIPVPGTDYRVGVDPLLGLLPVSGDLAAAVLSLYIVAEAAYIGAPRDTLVRMLVNIAVDTGVGSVPIAGDLFDVAWKANERNVSLLESHLESRTEVSIE